MTRLLLDALHCRNKQRPPIWLMRQAGRYMPEYQALRDRYSFLDVCHTPELVAEVTQMPIRRFGFDAAIIFSDILVMAEALGVGLRFEEQVGPIIERPLQSAAEVSALPTHQIHDALNYVSQGIKLAKESLSVPLLGFAGGPFTVAAYMIEGKSAQSLKSTKQWILKDPASFHALLAKITACTITYLKMQVQAGVDALQIFDTWAGNLSYPHFQEFAAAYLKIIVNAMAETRVPIVLFCLGTSALTTWPSQDTPVAISLDWRCDLPTARRTVPKNCALQGNLDPAILYADPTTIRKEVNKLLDTMKGDPGYIFNLGHGILPDTPIHSVQTLVECVKVR